MKLIYLHGVGDGDSDSSWFEALNASLVEQDMPSISAEDVIAPFYSDLLGSEHAEGAVPKPTVSSSMSGRSTERARFINRQIEAARLVGADASVQSLGFPLPDFDPADGAMGAIAKAMPNKWYAQEIKQIRAYVHRKAIRGAVLTRVLESIPQHGELVIVGHSLGSVVAVDILSRLSVDVSVRRLVTIGSPAHTGLFAVSRRELIGNFPYSRTNSWLNFFSRRDPVTRARGLATVFADVQDFRVSIGHVGHSSKAYLAQPSVARAVGSAFHHSAWTPRRTTRVTTALTDDMAALVLELHFRYAVSEAIDDAKVRARFVEATRINRLDLVNQVWEADRAGHPLPKELHLLAEGETPDIPDYWSRAGIIEQLTILALSDLTAPFEIGIDDASFRALPNIAEQIGLTREFGETLAWAVRSFNDQLVKLGKSGTNWQRWALVGAAVISITPIGFIALAPLRAAAITGGLAALGPVSAAGRLAITGGKVGTIAAITTAATVSRRGGSRRLSFEELLLAVAVAYAQKVLGQDFDDDIWQKVTDSDAELSAQINTLEALSDAKASSVTAMFGERDMIRNLLEFIDSNDLAPSAVPRIAVF
jgi:hypothetical protein